MDVRFGPPTSGGRFMSVLRLGVVGQTQSYEPAERKKTELFGSRDSPKSPGEALLTRPGSMPHSSKLPILRSSNCCSLVPRLGTMSAPGTGANG